MPDSHSIDVLNDAEAWLESFHEVATDPSGERAFVLNQRHCVESINHWRNNIDPSHWRKRRDEFCQQVSAIDCELDKILPEVGIVYPEISAVLVPLRPCLSDLRDAIQLEKVGGDTTAACRRWFEQKRETLRRLGQSDARWEPCRGCGTSFRDPVKFESHFFGFIPPPHAFPCGTSMSGERELSAEALERHISIVHDGSRSLAGSIYVDTDVQNRAIDEAVEECRAAYRTALTQILKKRLLAEREVGRGEEPRIAQLGLNAVRQWLGDMHKFATDPGGDRKRHLESRRFIGWLDAVYGEGSFKWNDTHEEIVQGGRALEFRLDRVLVITSGVEQRSLLKRLEKARKRLGSLCAAISTPQADRDAFDLWEDENERVASGVAEEASLLPEVDGSEVITHCPYCFENLAVWRGLQNHFESEHTAPPPGARAWMSPKDHLRKVDKEIEACRVAHGHAAALLAELARKKLKETPKPHIECDECGEGWADDLDLLAEHKAAPAEANGRKGEDYEPWEHIGLEENSWVIELPENRRRRFPALNGFRLMHYLLMRPFEQITPWDLRVASLGERPREDPQSTQAILDDAAASKLKIRILKAESDEETERDEGRDTAADEIREERELLQDELLKLRGLGGRRREFNSDREKAAKSNSGAIHYALKKIEQVAPELAEYLTAHVRPRASAYQPPATPMANTVE